MHELDPHAGDDNRFYLPVDLLRHVEDRINTGKMHPTRMMIITLSDTDLIDVYSANLSSLEAVGLLTVAQDSIVRSDVSDVE